MGLTNKQINRLGALLLLLGSLMLTACSQVAKIKQDPILALHIQQIERDLGGLKYVGHAKFGKPINPNAAAECHRSTDGLPRIIVDPDFWNNASVLMRDQLMVHELGHCMLNLNHAATGGLLAEDNSCQASVMEARMMYERCWAPYRSIYLKKLLE